MTKAALKPGEACDVQAMWFIAALLRKPGLGMSCSGREGRTRNDGENGIDSRRAMDESASSSRPRYAVADGTIAKTNNPAVAMELLVICPGQCHEKRSHLDHPE
jgi:hypothetical protein